MRAFKFARHIPLSKLLRRLELNLYRQLGCCAPRCRPGRSPAWAEKLPAPLFEPRRHLVRESRGDMLALVFLNRFTQIHIGRTDWATQAPRNFDQLWRMNLHYLEYLEGVGTEVWGRLVADWIKSNPPWERDAWKTSWNSYTLSLRVVVWLQELARRSGKLPEEIVDAAGVSAAAQMRFLEANLETDIGGNHLIKNIKALLWASACFEGPEPERWRHKGLALLSRELQAQILGDGVHYERSASYHAQVFADLLECRHAIGEDPFDGTLDRKLLLMAQAVADLAHPDGGPVLFNDAGLHMAYSSGQCLDAYNRLYGQAIRPRKVFAFPEAGYYGARNDLCYVVADCGRIAPDDLPAHGHGDVLSFELSVGGERIIVDQGVFEYRAGEKRQRSRTSSSHNTLTFDHADQAEFFGAFRCGRRPSASVSFYQAAASGFVLEGTHDGFKRLPGKPRHVRRFEAEDEKLAIMDRVEGYAGHPSTIAFLVHPAVKVSLEGTMAMLRSRSNAIKMTSAERLEAVPAVWWPDMGFEQKTSRLIVRLQPPVRSNVVEFRVIK